MSRHPHHVHHVHHHAPHAHHSPHPAVVPAAPVVIVRHHAHHAHHHQPPVGIPGAVRVVTPAVIVAHHAPQPHREVVHIHRNPPPHYAHPRSLFVNIHGRQVAVSEAIFNNMHDLIFSNGFTNGFEIALGIARIDPRIGTHPILIQERYRVEVPLSVLDQIQNSRRFESGFSNGYVAGLDLQRANPQHIFL